jgi:sensor histidine kinase YesM
MDEVTAGNMDQAAPIVTGDEIGHLSAHFNRMIGQTRELLARVVQEENRKSKAEYEMLEYRYRSLQSQINPHFIYNAMETVNALAKLDGNSEICDVVCRISAFFRQNTRNMQKRFIPVRSEFESLKQYAHIYHHIHGSNLSTPFTFTPAAADALIPTMVLQPVLENALVHGVRPAEDEAVVAITAADEGGSLCLEVRDNGGGMPPELVEQILHGPANEPAADGRPSTGVGMRNVRDRLRLIYGERVRLTIESREGEGTLVRIVIPLVYDEEELGENPNY